MSVVVEELKQKITAIAAKVRRYQGRVDSYRQNRLFGNNQRQFLHERVRLQLKECLDSGFVSSWMTRGRTSLLQRDKSKGNVASNYRPITCLPLMWKLLTGVIAD